MVMPISIEITNGYTGCEHGISRLCSCWSVSEKMLPARVLSVFPTGMSPHFEESVDYMFLLCGTRLRVAVAAAACACGSPTLPRSKSQSGGRGGSSSRERKHNKRHDVMITPSNDHMKTSVLLLPPLACGLHRPGWGGGGGKRAALSQARTRRIASFPSIDIT